MASANDDDEEKTELTLVTAEEGTPEQVEELVITKAWLSAVTLTRPLPVTVTCCREEATGITNGFREEIE